jgi:hypothetical protein
MLATMRKLMSLKMAIAEWIGTAVMLAVPYFVCGAVWALFHTAPFRSASGFDRVVLIVGTVASWPALLISGTYFG